MYMYMYVYAHAHVHVNMHTHSMCHTSLETERYSVRIKSELQMYVVRSETTSRAILVWKHVLLIATNVVPLQ